MSLTPGLYLATVRGIPGESIVLTSDGKNLNYAFTADGGVRRCYVFENARPLITLDFHSWFPHRAAMQKVARYFENGLGELADQIETQCKPPRIEEPGMWGVVEAGVHPNGESHHFTKGEVLGSNVDRWISLTDGHIEFWDDLIDPTLIREGLS